MSIDELTRRMELDAAAESQDQRIALLQDAHILDQDGKLDRDFFHSPENTNQDQ